MVVLLVILMTPLVFVLICCLVKYWKFCRSHKDLRSFEDIREHFMSVNAVEERDYIAEWWQHRRYRRVIRTVRRKQALKLQRSVW